MISDHTGADLFQLEKAYPRTSRFADRFVDGCNRRTGLRHLGEFAAALDCDHREPFRTEMTRSVTSSISPMPSTPTVQPPAPVDVEKRLGLFSVDLEAVANRLLGVISASPGQHPSRELVLVDLEDHNLV